MIFLTSSTSAVRSRRDVSHELGHQVLHSWMTKEDFEENKEVIEKEAALQQPINGSVMPLLLWRSGWDSNPRDLTA